VRALALGTLLLATAIGAQAPSRFILAGSRVTAERAFFGGHRVGVRFRFAAEGPIDVRVEIVRRRRVVKHFLLRDAAPRKLHRVRWDGVTSRGRAAGDGRYRVRIVPVGGRARRAGSFVMHSHFYPVRGPHSTRGARGQFGVPRSGGRRHEGFDVVAACGTPLARRAGRAGQAQHVRPCAVRPPAGDPRPQVAP
jgi:hypothetical protein